MGLVKEALFIAPDASLFMTKSVISGFNPAVILDDKIDHGALSIIDVRGKILKNIPFSPNQQKVEISTELIPGIYFMKLQSLKHSDMKRFIIIE